MAVINKQNYSVELSLEQIEAILETIRYRVRRDDRLRDNLKQMLFVLQDVFQYALAPLPDHGFEIGDLVEVVYFPVSMRDLCLRKGTICKVIGFQEHLNRPMIAIEIELPYLDALGRTWTSIEGGLGNRIPVMVHANEIKKIDACI